MQSVKSLRDVLSPVIQATIAEEESQAAKRQVFLVIARNSIRNIRETDAIVFAPPTRSLCECADFRGAVDFGVGVGLVLSLVPTPATEYSEPIAERLLEVRAESV